jgi:DNA-binding MarR family transcriptional regulator
MTRRLREELQMSKPFESLEEEVFLEIRRTSEVAGRWIAEALRANGLSPAQYNVLRILRGARPGSLPNCRIAERMVNHDPDLTRLLDRLEAAGLVAKARDGVDRRVVNARITAEGVRVVEEAMLAVRRRLQESLKGMSRARLGELADLLEEVRRPMQPPASPAARTRTQRKGVE